MGCIKNNAVYCLGAFACLRDVHVVSDELHALLGRTASIRSRSPATCDNEAARTAQQNTQQQPPHPPTITVKNESEPVRSDLLLFVQNLPVQRREPCQSGYGLHCGMNAGTWHISRMARAAGYYIPTCRERTDAALLIAPGQQKKSTMGIECVLLLRAACWSGALYSVDADSAEHDTDRQVPCSAAVRWHDTCDTHSTRAEARQR